ncbi:hypothetical protein HDU91_000797, partial [Kappamyces sp. JEL0680]
GLGRLTRSNYIKPVSTAVYQTLVRLRLLPPLPPRQNPVSDRSLEEGSEAQPAPSPPELFEPSAMDSKRRRELAQKALEERLAQKKAAKAADTPPK